MVRGLATLAAGIAALLGAAGAAAAAEVTYPDGKSEKIAPFTEVTGPAVITSDSGKGTIRLRSGAVLRYLPKEAESERTLPSGVVESRTVEMMFLKHGIADADLDFYTRLATPAFWLLSEKVGSRVQATVTSMDGTSAHARVAATSGMARLYIGAVEKVPMEAHLLAGQGARLRRGKDGRLGFRTDADNAWAKGKARIVHPVADGRRLDLYIPKATEGAIELLPGDEPRALRVENSPWSWDGAPCVAQVISKDGTSSEAQVRNGRWSRFSAGSLVSGDSDPPPVGGDGATVAREDSNEGQRRGTRLLDGHLEVVEMRADLTAEKPSLTFILERLRDGPSWPVPRDLRYTVVLGESPDESWNCGNPLTGSLNSPGDRATITLALGDARPALAGAWPCLMITP